MQDKELIINKSNELLFIKNRKEYTKLTLNCEVNPNLLFGFNNVKELTIKSEKLIENHLNEVTLNKLPFINTVEKINFINIRDFGKKEKKRRKGCFDKYDYYQPNFYILKYISFTYDSWNIYLSDLYLEKTKCLEEIEVNILDGFRINSNLHLPSSLKRIIINIFDGKYIIDFDYIPKYITRLNFDVDAKKCYLEYNDNLTKTYINIDIITGEIKKENKLTTLSDSLIKDNVLYIPDHITGINYYDKEYFNKIEHISFNIDLLKTIDSITNITDNKYLHILKTITIRSNKEMSLFPDKTIDVKKYGTLEDLYIENNKLYIVYENFMLVLNKEGIVEKKDRIIKEEKREEVKKISLDDYTIEELENYIRYRKLLEFKNDDEELTNALNIIGNRIIKKLTK